MMNEKHKQDQLPDRNTEYFLYQTMLGAWPIPLERLLPYMQKACREAKQQTSWHAPDERLRNRYSRVHRSPLQRSRVSRRL